MSNPQTMQIQEISAHPGPVPGRGTQRAVEVCKYIDVTTCIGCKACEVACVEWNDHPFRETTFRQHVSDDGLDGVELLEPDQVCRARTRRQPDVADAQGPVHALRGSGLLARVSGGWRDHQVRKWHRRFSAGELHRLWLLHFRLPVRHSEVQPARRRRSSNARFVPIEWARDSNRRASRRVRQGVCTSARSRTWSRSRARARRNCKPNRVSRMPASTIRNRLAARTSFMCLHDITQPELYGGLPANPVIPPSYTIWKWLAKPTGLLMAALGIFAVFFHRIAVGPKLPQPEPVPVVTEHPDEVETREKEKP